MDWSRRTAAAGEHYSAPESKPLAPSRAGQRGRTEQLAVVEKGVKIPTCDIFSLNRRVRPVNLTIIRKLLSPELLSQVQARLSTAKWVDGLHTAGPAASRVKRNLQLEIGSSEASELGDLVKRTLLANDRFPALALPRRLTAPLFSRYEVGMEYGAHTDDAVRSRDGLRTDLAGTLFLSEPDGYEGGELVVNGTPIKPAAGDLVLYPATTVHRVATVTRGVRLAAIFWVQSLVRSQEQREILLSLHAAIARLGNHPEALSIEAVQQNLLRMWAEP